jgi:hypothetical protein
MGYSILGIPELIIAVLLFWNYSAIDYYVIIPELLF